MPPSKLHPILYDVWKPCKALEVRLKGKQAWISIDEFFIMTTEVSATKQRDLGLFFFYATQSFYLRTQTVLLERRHFPP
jgi:hypothetical protein